MSDYSTTLAAAEAAAAKPKPARRWSLRAKVLLGVAFFVVLSTVIAVAAVLSSLSLGGSVAKGEFVAIWDGNPDAAIVDPADNFKTVKALPLPTKTKTTVTLPAGVELYYGEALDIVAGVKPDPNVTNRKAYVSALTTTAALPTGWTLTMVSGCGVVTSGSGSAVPVKFRITPAENATGTLSLTALGVRVVVTALPDGSTTADGSTVSGVTCTTKLAG